MFLTYIPVNSELGGATNSVTASQLWDSRVNS